MFKLVDYGRMINDSVRMRAYYEALRRTVRPDSVVVDIGAGTGIFSLLACQLGAQRVYAIDPTPWISVGKEMAAANGFADRIVFMQNFRPKSPFQSQRTSSSVNCEAAIRSSQSTFRLSTMPAAS